LQTYVVVLVGSVLVTLFQPSIYQATAVVLLPPVSDPRAEAAALAAPEVIKESIARQHISKSTTSTERAVPSGAAMPGRYALIVEDEKPAYVSELANAWAKTVAADSAGQTEVLVCAETPLRPVRPKKAQNIVMGGLLGLALGIALAFLRERFGSVVSDKT
jgi:uncharacterized protein involved in exopolysaccharide biosynthesis